jgi:hypothetical protein
VGFSTMSSEKAIPAWPSRLLPNTNICGMNEN